MTTSTKTANYTAEMEATLKQMYTGKDNSTEVAAIATALGKTPQSVRSKLAQMGVYVAKETAKTKRDGSTKAEIAEAIAAEVGLNEAEAEGIAKATKSALEKVLQRLVN